MLAVDRSRGLKRYAKSSSSIQPGVDLVQSSLLLRGRRDLPAGRPTVHCVHAYRPVVAAGYGASVLKSNRRAGGPESLGNRYPIRSTNDVPAETSQRFDDAGVRGEDAADHLKEVIDGR